MSSESKTESPDEKSTTKIKVMIATPCYGGMVTSEYCASLLRLQSSENMSFQLAMMDNESLIPRARNNMAMQFFFNSDCTHLVFVDADIGFPREALEELVNSNLEVCACPYPRKIYDFDEFKKSPKESIFENMKYILNLDASAGESVDLVHESYVEVRNAGTGFMCISRNCIEKMIDAHPELKCDTDVFKDGYALFDPFIDPDTKVYLSEDYAFCRRWKDIGGSVYVNVKYNLLHQGKNTYAGDFLKSMFAIPSEIEDTSKDAA
jgi:hypothetical protein